MRILIYYEIPTPAAPNQKGTTTTYPAFPPAKKCANPLTYAAKDFNGIMPRAGEFIELSKSGRQRITDVTYDLNKSIVIINCVMDYRNIF